ncbi:hypothetical protein E4U21_006189 [Claviceps maximensis]|nr:hypothetical protein E4U21_006189 [Claviceps maximensis]
MLAFRRRAARRRIPPLVVLLVLGLTTWYLIQPPDSAVVLALHFNAWRLSHALGLDDVTLSEDGGGRKYSVHIPSEVGCLIKTGYGTRHRVREQLRAFAVEGGVLGDEGRDFLVVGDWSHKRRSKQGEEEDDDEEESRVDKRRRKMERTKDQDLGVKEIHDVVGLVMESDEHGREWAEHDRFGKYRSLRGAVDAGDEAKAEDLGRRYGWELDALKFIKGMDMAYRRMPHKKWYMILDDDTFVVRASLQALLRTLDPARPMYLGNSVGDYRARFAHGGSAVLVSGAAMRMLFVGRPDVVRDAYARSLDETWGDRLVATTLQRLGVYVAEPYSRFFNGETPSRTRIRPERACVPVVSFHGLREPGAMLATGRALARRRKRGYDDDDDDNQDSHNNHDNSKSEKPVLWGELWDLFAQHPLQTYAAQHPPFRPGDHVGPGHDDPDVKTWKSLASPDDCRRKCTRGCLAWAFNTDSRECRTSPWLIPGSAAENALPANSPMVSGVNWSMAKSILRECR